MTVDEDLNDAKCKVNQRKRREKASAKQMVPEQFSHANIIPPDRQRTTSHDQRIEPESVCSRPTNTQLLTRVSMPDISCVDDSVANLTRP